jgi:hypothetical protein
MTASSLFRTATDAIQNAYGCRRPRYEARCKARPGFSLDPRISRGLPGRFEPRCGARIVSVEGA